MTGDQYFALFIAMLVAILLGCAGGFIYIHHLWEVRAAECATHGGVLVRVMPDGAACLLAKAVP